MIVYVGDLIKLSVNSMYVFGTANESRSHLRAVISRHLVQPTLAD